MRQWWGPLNNPVKCPSLSAAVDGQAELQAVPTTFVGTVIRDSVPGVDMTPGARSSLCWSSAMTRTLSEELLKGVCVLDQMFSFKINNLSSASC